MRSPTRAFGFLVAASVGLLGCSSDTVNNGALGFTVAESLLVLDPLDAASGYVVLSQGTGTCAALNTGVTLIPATQVGNMSYVIFLLGEVDANSNFIPLTAGSYPILDPSATFNPPGLLSNAAAVQTDSFCNGTEVDASSGTATVTTFDTTDGGTSGFNYTAVFGNTQVTGTYTLTTCLVPDTLPLADAGTCAVCSGETTDGGACAIP
jgi:hypothetical protein